MLFRRESIVLFKTIEKDPAIEFIIWTCVSYNFLLGIINTHILPVGNGVVVILDAMCVLFALLIVLKFRNDVSERWLTILWLLLCIHFVIALINLQIKPKYLRDLMIIPIFIALGSLYSGNEFRLIKRILIFVLIVGFCEAFLLEFYTAIINVKQYYISTRGVVEDSFYSEGVDLFVSAMRPGDRFIPFFDIHRVSSVFLEPVSAGNYTIFIAIYTAANWGRLKPSDKVLFLVSWFLLLALSDSRFAFACSGLIFISYFFRRKVFDSLYFFLLPLILILLFYVTFTFDLQVDDNFKGRLAKAVHLLYELNVSELLLGNMSSFRGWDCGLVYYIMSQSVFSFIVLWAVLFLSTPRSENEIFMVFRNGLCIYLTLILLISYSSFSIKTAALFFFLYGYYLNNQYPLIATTKSKEAVHE